MCSTLSNRGPAAAGRMRLSEPLMAPAPQPATPMQPLPRPARSAAAAATLAAPFSRPAAQPGSQAARQPGSQAARQPGSQAASQAARQPASAAPRWPPTRVPGAHLHLDEAAGRDPEGDQVLLPRVVGHAARGARHRHVPGLVAQAAEALRHLGRKGSGWLGRPSHQCGVCAASAGAWSCRVALERQAGQGQQAPPEERHALGPANPGSPAAPGRRPPWHGT
jgi:hypothetical protein